jgi:hypothetical protein
MSGATNEVKSETGSGRGSGSPHHERSSDEKVVGGGLHDNFVDMPDDPDAGLSDAEKAKIVCFPTLPKSIDKQSLTQQIGSCVALEARSHSDSMGKSA